jgi:hypothetical protein
MLYFQNTILLTLQLALNHLVNAFFPHVFENAMGAINIVIDM